MLKRWAENVRYAWWVEDRSLVLTALALFTVMAPVLVIAAREHGPWLTIPAALVGYALGYIVANVQQPEILDPPERPPRPIGYEPAQERVWLRAEEMREKIRLIQLENAKREARAHEAAIQDLLKWVDPKR